MTNNVKKQENCYRYQKNSDNNCSNSCSGGSTSGSSSSSSSASIGNNVSNSSPKRQIEKSENTERRNDNTPLLNTPMILSSIIMDPLQDQISCDSLNCFRQLRLVCKEFSNLSLRFYANFLKTKIAVSFALDEIDPKRKPSEKEKFKFVQDNKLNIALEIKRKDQKEKFPKCEKELNKRGIKVVKLEIDRSLQKPSTLDFLTGAFKNLN